MSQASPNGPERALDSGLYLLNGLSPYNKPNPKPKEKNPRRRKTDTELHKISGRLGFEQGEHVVHRGSKIVYRGQAASFLYLQPQK